MRMPNIIINTIYVFLFFEIIVETNSDQNLDFGLTNETSVNSSSVNGNDSNIVGGFIAREEQFPYSVAIQQPVNDIFVFICVGSIIGEKTVLSAAHCFYTPTSIKDYVVLAGSISLAMKTSYQLIKVREIIIHPNYQDIHSGYDIAVLRTDHKFHFNKHVKSIQLGSTSIEEKEKCVVCGWGAVTKDGRIFIDTLKGLFMDIKSNVDCLRFFRFNSLHVNIICAGGVKDEDTCFGDSGAPLVCNNKQYGVLSFGDKKCGVGFPTYFCDVTMFKEWIFKVIEMKNETPIHYRTLLMTMQLIALSFTLVLSSNYVMFHIYIVLKLYIIRISF